ncbi:hypothetical protein [Nesterenkonia pannonica]|uniref:Sir2 family NAD-dependent protein deacetylase n=1 Tax=Nesterenkonia pannonica TaxID=1548602 RepID=UPI002164C608|nr:Sir2 family NAD-dependent protein deacetylase [Nesterenkonia pannonica]
MWFGEMLPTEAFEQTAAAVRAADLVLVAGTSGIVQLSRLSAAACPGAGTPLIEVNPEETELSELMDHCVRGPSGEVLPKLVPTR